MHRLQETEFRELTINTSRDVGNHRNSLVSSYQSELLGKSHTMDADFEKHADEEKKR
jgi:hypothetical protein